jgi:hypothetical protein
MVLSKLGSSARPGQGCSHATRFLVRAAGRPEQEGAWLGGGAGRQRHTSKSCAVVATSLGSLNDFKYSINTFTV